MLPSPEIRSHKSQLLFGGFRSTIPGFGEVWDGGPRRKVKVGRRGLVLRQCPDAAEDFLAGRSLTLFGADETLEGGAELVHFGIGVLPGVDQGMRVERRDQGAD